MDSDEREIRQLIETWMAATRAGDSDTILSLIAEDVVFLVPGRPVMHKAEFAALSKAQAAAGGPAIDGTSDIQEIRVLGDWAFMRTRLTVFATPAGGGAPTTRSGHTLSILRKERGKWRLARDANLLAPVPPSGA